MSLKKLKHSHNMEDNSTAKDFRWMAGIGFSEKEHLREEEEASRGIYGEQML